MAIRRNDTVVVIAGKEKGKRGRVLAVLPARQRVLVERVNLVKRHQRPTQKVRQGGIIEREASLHVSNVMLVCGKCGQPPARSPSSSPMAGAPGCAGSAARPWTRRRTMAKAEKSEGRSPQGRREHSISDQRNSW